VTWYKQAKGVQPEKMHLPHAHGLAVKQTSLRLRLFQAWPWPWGFFFFFFGVGELFITHTCNERNHKCQMEGHSQTKLQAAVTTWKEAHWGHFQATLVD